LRGARGTGGVAPRGTGLRGILGQWWLCRWLQLRRWLWLLGRLGPLRGLGLGWFWQLRQPEWRFRRRADLRCRPRGIRLQLHRERLWWRVRRQLHRLPAGPRSEERRVG